MATLYQNYNTGDDDSQPVGKDNGQKWSAQTFTPSTAHKITSVKIKAYRVNSPGTITVSIRATSSGHPTGGDLCSGTTDGDTLTTDTAGEWREITLGAGYDLLASTKYAIVIRCLDGDDSNHIRCRMDSSSPTYAGGNWELSIDSGVNWTTQAGYDFMFEEWGDPSVTEKSSSDTGSGVETLGSRLFGVAETGSGIGVSSLLAALIGTEDSGLGSEFAAKILSALDSGSGTEAHIARLLAATETGSALEAAFLIKHLFSSDYGLGGDAIATLLALVIGSEVGSGSEQFRAKIITFPGAFDMRLLTSAGEVRIPSKGVNL